MENFIFCAISLSKTETMSWRFISCDQIRSFLQIWSNSLKKSLMENFIFCAVWGVKTSKN